MRRIQVLMLCLILAVAAGPICIAQQSAEKKEAPTASAKSAAVNINTATASDLERLPGIGPSLAKKILEFRQKNGSFKSPADLMAVSGIGEKKYEQIKHLISVK